MESTSVPAGEVEGSSCFKKLVRLFLLPGLGADAELFRPQRDAFPGLIVPPWIEPRRNEALASYAARMAEWIDASGPLVIGGVCFGGMVALEMAARLKVDAVILISGCRSPRGIKSHLRFLAPLVRLLPASLLKPRRPLAPLVAAKFGCVRAAHRELLEAMILRADPEFLKWGCSAVAGWKPSPVTCPVWHVHGAADRILPANLGKPDVVVAGAGHLMNVTHAAAVNAFLGDCLDRAGRGRTARQAATESR